MHLQNCLRLINTSNQAGLLKTTATLQKSILNHRNSNRFWSTTMTASSKKVAVVLSGSGVYDGTEIHEAAACFAALTRQGATPVAYSIDKAQHHAIAHNSGAELPDQRNVLIESARISRGAVEKLSDLKATSDIDAVVFPGGFGAAKNLSDFAFKGTDMTVDPEVERVLKEFNKSGKPIALCCIAPILAAKVLGSQGVKLTMGKKGDEKDWPHGGAIDAAKSFGATMVEMEVSEALVDESNKIVTTPAYMYNGKFHEIQDGVTKMITELVKMK